MKVRVLYTAEYHGYRKIWMLVLLFGFLMLLSSIVWLWILAGMMIALSLEQIWWWSLILQNKPTRIWFPPLVADHVEPIMPDEEI